ncbi:mastermind-like domain-containing protein 1 isoform X5 [Eriocheir sinensis]|nr:mastermind-like domain-containing protein 1 isoform X5 [Eriocheir sinensis]XP_050694872.1 mastermind-like domain-containing protein 1 isoform X5 [Eriocheir sinensis]XP_050694873.1 mastermind-like domain-containing protein 1 isoform X5 [Eriocheir sinensis]
MVWLGMVCGVCWGWVWCGVWCGWVWCGVVCGAAGYGVVCRAAGCGVWCSWVWCGVWCGWVWCGVWCGSVWCGVVCGVAGCGVVWQDLTRRLFLPRCWWCLQKDKQDPDGDIIMRLEYGLLNSSSLELIERVKQFANLVLALMMLFARYNHWMVGDKFERLAPSLPRSYPPQPPKGRTEEQPPTPSLAAPHLLSSPPPPPPAPPLSTWTVEKGCLVWRCLIGVVSMRRPDSPTGHLYSKSKRAHAASLLALPNQPPKTPQKKKTTKAPHPRASAGDLLASDTLSPNTARTTPPPPPPGSLNLLMQQK